jgi:hypothetical protein
MADWRDGVICTPTFSDGWWEHYSHKAGRDSVARLASVVIWSMLSFSTFFVAYWQSGFGHGHPFRHAFFVALTVVVVLLLIHCRIVAVLRRVMVTDEFINRKEQVGSASRSVGL